MDVQEATSSVNCKVVGCTQEAVGRRGVYAGLCATHIDARRRAETAGRTQRIGATVDGFQDKVKRLGKVARDVDRLRATAKKRTEEALIAKQRADEAERELHALARELMGQESAMDGVRAVA